VAPGGRPLTLRLITQDVAGHAVAESLALGPAPAGRPRATPAGTWVAADSAAAGGLPGFAWSVAPGRFFETARLAAADLGRPEAPDELKARSHVFALEPALTPLRGPLRVGIEAAGPRSARAPAGGVAGVSLYRDSGGGWDYVGADLDWRAGWIGAETRALGRFALFRDATAPRVKLRVPPRVVPPGRPARWALEARITEEGSGVDARASRFVVDGRRVPSEWDAVMTTLRWRPLRPPASGRHEVEIVAADRAGNVRRRRASFVLD
jgi:hypothetical protein